MPGAQQQPAAPAKGWASPTLAVLELLLVALIFLADWYRLVPFSKTPFILLLGWISLRLRGVPWRAVGLARFRNWPTTFGLGSLAGAALSALELLVTQPLLVRLTHRWPDLSDLRPLIGNPKLFLVGLLASWILAALGEELAYRGYLMNLVAQLLGQTKTGWIISLVVVSAAFGFGHFDQGITGMIENVINGLLLGGIYLACGRNLAVPIMAHGVANSVDLFLIYVGTYPGL